MTDANPSERELDILKVLWNLGESKVRDVHAALNAQQPTAFTTVQTLLRIMADKGLVQQRAEGRTLFYTPVIPSNKSARVFSKECSMARSTNSS